MAHIAAKQKTAASIDFTGFTTIFYFSTVKDGILSSQFDIYFLLVKKQFDLYITDALHHLKIISSLLLKIKNHFAELIRYLKHHLLTKNSFH